jgi:hypothetical protein
MLGLVLSLVVSVASAMPSAGVTCPDEPETCDGSSVAVGASPGAGTDLDDGPRDYATPAEVDCPMPGDGPIASSECDNVPLDLWYRVSRSPDSERPNGALVPTPRRARAGHGSSCGGSPADPGRLAAPDVQALAIFALPGLLPGGARGHRLAGPLAPPSRTLTPPDRPPRA